MIKNMKKYYIRYELLGGIWYYMIYKKELFGLVHIFWERWNTAQSATERLKELN